MVQVLFSGLICLIIFKVPWIISDSALDCPEIINRTRWGARTPLEVSYMIIPVDYVVVHHTFTEGCNSETSCSSIVSSLQNFHIGDLGFHDIGFNFLVGGDGRIYEGTGWYRMGAHTRGFNKRSIGLAFIGNFSEVLPERKQLIAAREFLNCGANRGELDQRYKICGARQIADTESPGLRLYHEIQEWSHFNRSPK